TGMTCASCVQTIEKATSKLDGVIESNVNLATEKMAVTYDPAVVSVSDIIQAVSKSGYEAHEDTEVTNSTDKKEKNIKSMSTRLFWPTIFPVSWIYFSTGHLIGSPLPGAIYATLSSEAFELVQLILTVPVVVLGRKFYRVRFKTELRGHANFAFLIAFGTRA